MTCIRTGALIYNAQRAEWHRCDAHRFDNVWLFRVCPAGDPDDTTFHFTVHEYDVAFWDRPYGTLIARDVTYHGYAGIPIPKEFL